MFVNYDKFDNINETEEADEEENEEEKDEQDEQDSLFAAMMQMPLYDEDGVEIPEEELPWNNIADEPEEAENEDSTWEEDETETVVLPPFVPTRPAAERRKRVAQSVREEALRRLELSARTLPEFQELVAWYDREEQSRMRKERRHETLRGNTPVEMDALPEGHIFPSGLSRPTFRQISRGEFDDAINTCLFEMHNLTDREHLRIIVENLKIDHKEILFFLGIRHYPTQMLAELRGQTERNIRKVRATVRKRIHRKLYTALLDLQKTGTDLIRREQKFLCIYTPPERRRATHDQSV